MPLRQAGQGLQSCVPSLNYGRMSQLAKAIVFAIISGAVLYDRNGRFVCTDKRSSQTDTFLDCYLQTRWMAKHLSNMLFYACLLCQTYSMFFFFGLSNVFYAFLALSNVFYVVCFVKRILRLLLVKHILPLFALSNIFYPCSLWQTYSTCFSFVKQNSTLVCFVKHILPLFALSNIFYPCSLCQTYSTFFALSNVFYDFCFVKHILPLFALSNVFYVFCFVKRILRFLLCQTYSTLVCFVKRILVLFDLKNENQRSLFYYLGKLEFWRRLWSEMIKLT